MLPIIDDLVPKLIIYLTNGVSSSASDLQSEYRYQESIRVSKKFLIPRNCQLMYWGVTQKWSEGELYKNVNVQFIDKLQQTISSKYGLVHEIVTTAFEGAHQDHDVAAFIARAIGKKFNLIPIEFASYPQKYSKFYSFQVLKPKFPQGIPIKYKKIRILTLAFRLMHAYKTQRKTWLGLGFFTIYNYAFAVFKTANPKAISNLSPCFYEYRGRVQQSEVLYYLKSV